MKKELEKRFKNLFKNKRLLAIQLNGFSHTVFYDNGKNTDVQMYRYSAYTTIENADLNEKLKVLFLGFSHYTYQNNPQEIVYILPSER